MRAGLLKDRVTLQSVTLVRNSTGQMIEQVVPLNSGDWADVAFAPGLEIVKANSAVTFTRCSVRMRYTPGITSAGNRLVFDGTSYNIKSVLPTRSKGYMDLVCEAKSG